ncbi:unnamed protein product [Cuscuta campestris]|uniref:Uncharacterized protein n=1 Tax=Cuscuta campestris TaxID=132261 RepID=A0A484LUT9_9ASTE|nr:unnamed protein product [Cuscuta campestris]
MDQSQVNNVSRTGSTFNTPVSKPAVSEEGKEIQSSEPVIPQSGILEKKTVEPNINIEDQPDDTTGGIQQKSYADVLKLNQTIQVDLKFIQSDVISGQRVAKLTKDDVIEEYGIWDKAVNWVSGKAVDITKLSDIPIWIQFPNLQMKYWSLSGLSKLGSLVGKPVKRDKATATKAKWNFARIQVEVQAQQICPDKIQFVDEEDRVITQEFAYEWKPVLCDHCNKLGHESQNGRKKEKDRKNQKGGQQKIWVPKQKQGKNEVVEEEEGTGKAMTTRDNIIPTQENGIDQDGFQMASGKKAARRMITEEKGVDPPYGPNLFLT